MRDELGEKLYSVYKSENSIHDRIYNTDGECRLLIIPMGDAEDGSTLLHGEGVVVFDPGTLQPIDHGFFVW